MKSRFTILTHECREKILNELSNAMDKSMQREKHLHQELSDVQETLGLLRTLNTIVCDHTKEK